MDNLSNQSDEQVLVSPFLETIAGLPAKPQIRRSESLLSISLQAENKRRKSSVSIYASGSGSARVAGKNMQNFIGRRFRTYEKDMLRHQEMATQMEKQKMEVLVAEGSKTAIPPIHINSELDGDAISRSMIDWMEEHDLEHLLPL